MRLLRREQTANLTLIGVVIGLEILIAYLCTLHFELGVFVLGALIVIALALIKMEWTLPVLVFSLFLMGINMGGLELSVFGTLRIYHFIAAFLIIRWTYFVLLTGYKRFFLPNAIVAPCLAFLAWATLSIIWSPDLQTAVWRWEKVVMSVLGGLMLINISEYKSYGHRVIFYWVLSAIVGGSVFGYSLLALGTGLSDTWVAHQNIISEMMNVCLFMSISMAIMTRKTLLCLFCILTAIFTVVVNTYTGCRGGFMGLIAGLIVFGLLGIFNSKIGRKIPFTLTVVFLLCVAGIAIWVSQMESLEIQAFGRQFDLLNPQETDTFAWRMDTIRAAWRTMNESSAWIWGMGVGAWEYLQEELMGSTWARFIHNFYFNWFFQYGVVGSVIMVWLFARVFMPIVQAYKWFTDYRTRWSLNCLIALYVAMVVHGVVSIEETNSYVWILFATTAVFIDYLKEQHDQQLPSNTKL